MYAGEYLISNRTLLVKFYYRKKLQWPRNLDQDLVTKGLAN